MASLSFSPIFDGFSYPVGILSLPDNSLIVSDMSAGTLTRLWDGKRETLAQLDGGPTGIALGPDGAVYVCNNGGVEWVEHDEGLMPGFAVHDYSGGRIDRVDLATGEVDRLYTRCGDVGLRAPFAICFDQWGNFYCTDRGKPFPRKRELGGLYYGAPDGTKIVNLVKDLVAPSGLALSVEEDVIYLADSIAGRVWSYGLAAPGEISPESDYDIGRVLAVSEDAARLEGLALDGAGRIHISTSLPGGVRVVGAEGSMQRLALEGLSYTGLCFVGDEKREALVALASRGQILRGKPASISRRLGFGA